MPNTEFFKCVKRYFLFSTAFIAFAEYGYMKLWGHTIMLCMALTVLNGWPWNGLNQTTRQPIILCNIFFCYLILLLLHLRDNPNILLHKWMPRDIRRFGTKASHNTGVHNIRHTLLRPKVCLAPFLQIYIYIYNIYYEYFQFNKYTELRYHGIDNFFWPMQFIQH